MSERIRGIYDDALYKSTYALLYFTAPQLLSAANIHEIHVAGRPTCSDSLNPTPPAPLYLRTLRRYTNPILLSLLYNNVEATFDFVEATFYFVERIVRLLSLGQRCFDIVAGVDGA